MTTPWPRRAAQLFALGVVGAAPVVGLWGVGTARVWSPAELRMRYGVLAEPATAAMRAVLGDPPAWAESALIGGTWSITIGGVELADPLAVLVLLTSGGLSAGASGLVLGALAVAVVHVLTGRAFCGYLCPYGTLSRLVDRVRRPLKRRGLVLDVRPPTWIRYALGAAMLVAPLAGLSLTQLVLPYLGVTGLLSGLLFGGAAGLGGLVLALLLTDLLLWDHGVCRALCPSGAWQRELGRLRVFRLVGRPQAACHRGCTLCLDACWLGLDPRAGGRSPDCDGCARCTTVCPTSRLTLGLPRQRLKTPHTHSAGKAAAAVVLLGVALGSRGCVGGSPPEAVSLTPAVSTPFMPPAEGLAVERGAAEELSTGESAPAHAFVEVAGPAGVVTVGAADTGDGLTWLRLFVEEAPGEPYRGPLTVVVQDRVGEITLSFERPREPRSAPRPSLFEAALRATPPVRVRFEDGPAAGMQVAVPDPNAPDRRAAWLLTAPPLGVLGVWLAGLFSRRLRRTPPGTNPATSALT